MANMIMIGAYLVGVLFAAAVLMATRENYLRTGRNKIFLVLCFCVIGWLLTEVAILSVLNVGINIFFWNVRSIFVAFCSLLLFLVMFKFSLPGRKLPKYAVILFSAIPVLTVIVVLTSPLHNLVRDVEHVTVWPRHVVYTLGPWFAVHTASSFFLAISSIIVVIYGMINKTNDDKNSESTNSESAILESANSESANSKSINSDHINLKSNRTSSLLFIAALAVLLAGNLLFQLNVLPPAVDPTAIGAIISLAFVHIAVTDGRQKVGFRIFNTLKSRVTFPVVWVVFILVAIILYYAAMNTRILVEESESNRMNTATSAVLAYLESYEQQLRAAATALGSSVELIRLIDAGVREDIWQYAADRQEFWDVDAIIVSSAEGYTLARSHIFDSYGDDITGVPSIAAGLRGEVLTLYTPTPTAPIVMTTASPVMDGDRFMGAVVVNFDVGMNHVLDRLSGVFDVDLMVFRREVGEDGTVSWVTASSTIIGPDGERTEGFVAGPEITSIVIDREEHLSLEMDLYGVPYHAYIYPVPGADGRPNGMFFIGISQAPGILTISTLQRNTILMNLAGLLVAAAFMFFLIYKSLKPLDDLGGNIKMVAAGNINVNIDRSKINRGEMDEIGMLTQDVCGLVDVIKDMVADMVKFNHETNITGDIEYRIDPTRYQGSYNEMIVSLNSFVEKFVKDMVAVLNVIGKVNKGDFNAELEQMPGKKIIMNKTVDELMENLQAIQEEVKGMTNRAAVEGELSFQIDAGKYDGGWQDIMTGLNDLAKAVNAPIVEIRDVMGNLSQGDFSTKVTGNYSGDFLQIKDAVNNTIEALQGYITEITDALARVSAGDLTYTISRDYVGSFDAIKDSLNNISTKLNKTITEISAGSEQVLTGAKQISTSAMDLANGASTQSSSVQELNATVELINQQTKKNAENAKVADELSRKSTENAGEGNVAMQQTLSAMNQIKDASDNISKIIKSIQDIAFQTNLLALNASVEAARAGEHGKGFAVVADEVRSLASRSQTAASETTELINHSINSVETGAGIAQSTATALDTIVENAGQVLEIVSAITGASQEQAEAITQVVLGLQQISQVVQSNSAVSEETAAASEELTSQAEMLMQLVSYFRLK